MEVLGDDELHAIFSLLNTQDLLSCSGVSHCFHSQMKKTLVRLCERKHLPRTTSVRDYALLFAHTSMAFGEFFNDYTYMSEGDNAEKVMELAMSGNYQGIAILMSNIFCVARKEYRMKGDESMAGIDLSAVDTFLQANPTLLPVIDRYKLMFADLLAELPCAGNAEPKELCEELLCYLIKTKFTQVWWLLPPEIRELCEKYRFYFLHTEESISAALEEITELEEAHGLLTASCRYAGISTELFDAVLHAYKNLCVRQLMAEGMGVCYRERETTTYLLRVSNDSFSWLIENGRYDLLVRVAPFIREEDLETKAEKYLLQLLLNSG